MKKGFYKVLNMLWVILLFTQCKEERPPINFEAPAEIFLDTQYLLPSAPAAQTKNVLLYDVTGVRCNNCPKAAARAKVLDSIYRERLNILAVYPTASPTLTEPWPGYEALTSPLSQQLVDAMGAVPVLPTGIVDQTLFSGSRYVSYPQWDAKVAERASLSGPINIDLVSVFEVAKGYHRLEAKVSLHSSLSNDEPLAFMLAISEDSIPGLQSSTLVAGGLDYDYVHYHVLRDIITPISGDVLDNATYDAGRVFEKHFKLPLKSNWRKSKLHVVAWVFNTVSKEVLQSVEIKYE